MTTAESPAPDDRAAPEEPPSPDERTGRKRAPLVGTLTRGELGRKLLHMAAGSIAFSFYYLGSFWAALLVLTALCFNVFLLPRLGGRRMWRRAELDFGQSVGMVLYPTAVLLLIVVFWQRLEVAAAVWGILAFGDGMATLLGRAFGRAKLPWNPEKSWVGTASYVIFGTAGATVLLQWTAPGRYDPLFAGAVCLATALLGGVLESRPQGLDDNLGVPLVSGLTLLGLLLTEGHWDLLRTEEFWIRAGIGLAVNLVLAGAGYAARGVDLSGGVAGVSLGTVLYAFLDWRGYLLLVAFFVVGTACTKIGYERKAARELAQEKGGRRGARHAFANAGVGVFCAVLGATTHFPVFFAVSAAAAFATAAADTAGSEIGQLWGRRTFLLTTGERVPPGTDGAVSLEGTLAGIFASILVGAAGAAVGLYPWFGVVVVVLAAFVGTLLESVFGATLERKGLLDNEAMNFLNTLVGALAGGGLTGWLLV